MRSVEEHRDEAHKESGGCIFLFFVCFASSMSFVLFLRAPVLMLDFGSPVLKIDIPHGNIGIQSGFLEVLILPDSQRGAVYHRTGFYARAREYVRRDVGDGTEEGVRSETNGIAQARGAEEWPDDVHYGLHTVKAHGLPEIFILRVEVEILGGHIDHTDYSDGRVDTEAQELDPCSFELALQGGVHKPDRHKNVMVSIAQVDAETLGQDLAVHLGDGLQEPEVELVVELEKGPVHRFQRIRNDLTLR